MDRTVYTDIPEWNRTVYISLFSGDHLEAIPRDTESFHLHLFRRGAALLKVNGKRLMAQAPCLLCIGSRDGLEVVNQDCTFDSIIFHPGFINDSFLRLDPYDPNGFTGTLRSDQYYFHPFLWKDNGFEGLIPVSPPLMQRFGSLYDSIKGEMTERRDGYWPCRTRSFFLEVLILIRMCFQSSGAMTEFPILARDTGDIDHIIVYIHAHYAEKLNLPDLAARFATNRTSLSNRFRQRTGMSVGEYLLDLRIRVAGLLLRDTELPIQEIVYRSGFADPSHFGRIFRRETGCNPSEYRSQHSWLIGSAS